MERIRPTPAMASATTIRIAATANVVRRPLATASGHAVVMSVVVAALFDACVRCPAPLLFYKGPARAEDATYCAA